LTQIHKYDLINSSILIKKVFMLEKMVRLYYDFFDRKIKHSTSVVFVISIMIIFVWMIFSSNDIILYAKSSVLDSNDIINNIKDDNIITISWTKYRVVLEKLD